MDYSDCLGDCIDIIDRLIYEIPTNLKHERRLAHGWACLINETSEELNQSLCY